MPTPLPIVERFFCVSCDAWQPALSSSATGKCRRNSPRPLVAGSETAAIWPVTLPNDSCAQHSGGYASIQVSENEVYTSSTYGPPGSGRTKAKSLVIIRETPNNTQESVTNRTLSIEDARKLIDLLIASQYSICATASCDTCEFYHVADGQCRRINPEPIVATAGGGAATEFATVNAKDWCSYYQQNPARKLTVFPNGVTDGLEINMSPN